ncbi:hypothetical protein CBS101457_004213 [Exobasidium rhododendri]|nr:hypothetical protein CBS101457_004213 [Exobasidium rhododendri]
MSTTVLNRQSLSATSTHSDIEKDVEEKAQVTEGTLEGAAVDSEAKKKLQEAHIVPLQPDEHISEEEYKSTLRRIDTFLMPLMCLSVLFQYLDKSSLNYANLLGIRTDLNFSAYHYGWLGSIFYLGYLAASPVHGYFLQKCNLTYYLSANIFLWGVTLTLHAAAFNYAGLVACRLFLGIFEGALTPGFILITGRFYKSSEQVARTSIWFGQNGTAQILGGAIAYGVLSQKATHLKVWQELYIILGLITVAYSFAVFFFLPDKPETTRLLTPRQRVIAIERIRTNKTGLHDKRFKRYQFIESIKDVRLYIIFFLICASNIANGISSNFSSAIIKGLGFDSKKTALIGMSTGASEIVAIAIGVVIAYYTKTRAVPGVFSFLIALIGGILLLTVTDKVTQVAAYCLIFFFPVASPLVYSWLSSCLGGTTKKIVFNVVLQLAYTTGNVVGPQVAGVAPSYHQGKLVMCVMFGICIVLVSLISIIHFIWNKKREANGEGEGEVSLSDLADYTDKELRSFRYPY